MYMRKMPDQERNQIPNDRWLDYFLGRDIEEIQMDLEEYLKNMNKWGQQPSLLFSIRFRIGLV